MMMKMMQQNSKMWNDRNSRQTIGRSRNGTRNGNVTPKRNPLAFLIRGLLLLALLYAFVAFRFQPVSLTGTEQKVAPGTNDSFRQLTNQEGAKTRKEYCEFRKYPPRRYYGLSDDKDSLPDFLGKAEYIYGQLPQMIHPTQQSNQKLCVDQSSWYVPQKGDGFRLPFADGTNPSILKLIDNPRIDPSLRQLWGPNAHYLTTICMTNSQCAWRDSLQEQVDYRLSTQAGPSTVRTVLLILDENFETLHEATIRTTLDAQWGRRVRAPAKDEYGNYPLKEFPLDDARLFTFQGQVWLSYREGKVFGYDKQVLNRVHFDVLPSTGSLLVSLRASETETLCCGRNMALIDNVHTNRLQALTWVDPVTVADVEFANAYNGAEINRHRESRRMSSVDQGESNVRDVQDKAAQLGSVTTSNSANATSGDRVNGIPLRGINRKQDHRRLSVGTKNTKKVGKKESHFHGTNGFMVYLPHSGEYLGVGHFHRPPGREANAYARFGHHYTHAFFTISDAPPYRLKRLSPELVLPSHANPSDAEVIQFWSGLELMDDNTLAVAYGINDCEGAASYLDLSVVEGLLRDVPEGKEVVDLIRPLE